jgi:5-deoxy-D-glucuronate isomerase
VRLAGARRALDKHQWVVVVQGILQGAALGRVEVAVQLAALRRIFERQLTNAKDRAQRWRLEGGTLAILGLQGRQQLRDVAGWAAPRTRIERTVESRTEGAVVPNQTGDAILTFVEVHAQVGHWRIFPTHEHRQEIAIAQRHVVLQRHLEDEVTRIVALQHRRRREHDDVVL